MLTCFYDIESLDNVFTLCNFAFEHDRVDVFYLVDDQRLLSVPDLYQTMANVIYAANKNFTGKIMFYDLHEKAANDLLAETMGLSDSYMVNDPDNKSSYPDRFRPVCDTDPGYDEDKHPYLMGYNSYNYDTTMLAMYFHEVYPILPDKSDSTGATKTCVFQATTAKLMRQYNDELFLSAFKTSMPTRLCHTYDTAKKFWEGPNYKDPRWKIRKSMLNTGRHLDVARLNEKQQKVGLKRLLGMLGYQILESKKLRPGQSTIETPDQLFDLVAYNVSDCVNLKYGIFDHKVYQGQFSLKKGLLQSYPELIYEQDGQTYKPNISSKHVRRDRLTIDSSAAQLATKALCPYGHLKDIPVVSFLYPSARKAAELGIQQVNVLEETRKFFYRNFQQPELRQEFDRIYAFYKRIEGKNFNMSKNYMDDWQNQDGYQSPEDVRLYSKGDTCLYYFNADGSPSSCFVTFSIGGIHGAEYNKALYDADMEQYETACSLMGQVQALYPDPLDLKKAKTVSLTLPDGTIGQYKAAQFLKTGSTLKTSAYKDISAKKPVLFKTDEKTGGTKLNPKYVFTSADPTNHEDFTSYYPNLLRMMSAFYNEGLGYDRYNEIFENKQKFGKLMKDKSLTQAERDLYSVQRDGTKLVLNSASGAADANFESNIRMNNVIISMRIIGQLFSWRIGQAQTIAGARITSTNTDGLFSVLDPAINNPVLERESKDIGVEIEPEETYLISKDSNNRIEMDETTGKIDRASGGTLACHQGPDPQKSLAHPAIMDWALCEYLVVAAHGYKDLAINKMFDTETGMNILKSATARFPEKTKLLNMFQNVIASSPGSVSYNFGTTDSNPGVPIILQHYNRVFIMKDKTPGTIHIHAAVSKKITPATRAKRLRDNERPQIHDDLALQVLNANGVKVTDIPADSEATVKKVTNIETDWYMLVENRDLKQLTDQEMSNILDNLDYEKYLELFQDGFNANWRNTNPSEESEPIFKQDDSIVKPAKSAKTKATGTPATPPASITPAAPTAQVPVPSLPSALLQQAMAQPIVPAVDPIGLDAEPPFDMDPPVDEIEPMTSNPAAIATAIAETNWPMDDSPFDVEDTAALKQKLSECKNILLQAKAHHDKLGELIEQALTLLDQ